MDELSRLHALDSYQIMDTLPQMDLDEITELASIICGTPISLVTLLDSDRQWFKSKVGLDISETPREYAFCHYAIQSPHRIMIVEDSHKDARFKDTPLITGDPYLRFYAGAPIVTADGHALGSLCVIDHMPRSLTSEQQRALGLLSKRVLQLFELRKVNMESVRLFSASNRRLFTLSEQSPDFIAVLDDSLVITYANKGHDNVSREELIGKPSLDMVSSEYRGEFISQCRKALQAGEQGGFDLKLMNGASDSQWVTCRIAPLRGEAGAVLNVLVIHTDILERKASEESRVRHIEALEKMMFMISHKLRYPISSAMGLATLLRRPDISLEEKLKCIDYIHRSVVEADGYVMELSEFVNGHRISKPNEWGSIVNETTK